MPRFFSPNLFFCSSNCFTTRPPFLNKPGRYTWLYVVLQNYIIEKQVLCVFGTLRYLLLDWTRSVAFP